jgi:hypothetical protein
MQKINAKLKQSRSAVELNRCAEKALGFSHRMHIHPQINFTFLI